MGGKLFAEEGAQRITTEEYKENYVPGLSSLLEPLSLRFNFVDFYASKEDHGNVNILVNKMTILEGASTNTTTILLDRNPNRKAVVISYLKSLGYKVKTNSDVVSFLYDDKLQVDLIFTKPKNYEYSLSYYSFNDLGGLLGRLTRGLRLKHGCNGLEYVVYNEDKSTKLGSVLLTTDHDTTLELLGLSVEKFKQGFKDLDDIFKYVISSTYFGTAGFIFDDVTSKDRHRDKKRNTFIKFEEYCIANKDVLPHTSPNLPLDKLAFIYSKFPFAQVEVEALLLKEKQKKEVHAKFNGYILMEMYPEFKDNPKEMGVFIRTFKNKFDQDMLLNMSPEQIIEQCKTHKLAYKD